MNNVFDIKNRQSIIPRYSMSNKRLKPIPCRLSKLFDKPPAPAGVFFVLKPTASLLLPPLKGNNFSKIKSEVFDCIFKNNQQINMFSIAQVVICIMTASAFVATLTQPILFCKPLPGTSLVSPYVPPTKNKTSYPMA